MKAEKMNEDYELNNSKIKKYFFGNFIIQINFMIQIVLEKLVFGLARYDCIYNIYNFKNILEYSS